jgi:hypothetical protein
MSVRGLSTRIRKPPVNRFSDFLWGKRDLKFIDNVHDTQLPFSHNGFNNGVNELDLSKSGICNSHSSSYSNSYRNVIPSINMAQASRSNDSGAPLKLYRQNIRGMKGKLSELMVHLSKVTSDIVCVTEHHLNASEIELTYLPSYILGANFCRETLKNGGACIYIHQDLKFTTVKVQIWAKEQDLEIADVQIKLKHVKLIIITVYRAPVGNFDYFLCKLDAMLKFLYKVNIEFLICGDINVNYVENNSKRTQLDEMLRTYNLIIAINFPTRIQKPLRP